MSEVEEQLKDVIKEYAELDKSLTEMYARLRELDDIIESHSKSRTSLDISAENLKATNESLIREIDVLKDLAQKLGNNQLTTINEKIDNFEKILQNQQQQLRLIFNEELDGFEKSLQKKQQQLQKTLNEKLDGFENILGEHRQLLERNGKVTTALIWLVAIATGFLVFSIFN